MKKFQKIAVAEGTPIPDPVPIIRQRNNISLVEFQGRYQFIHAPSGCTIKLGDAWKKTTTKLGNYS